MNSFSVIIPVYNCENTLRKTVESILKQNYTDIEIILVDDGSTDNSLNECERLSVEYKYVRVFHKKNEGQLSARLYGIRVATRRWLLFLDADDEFKEGALVRLDEVIKSNNGLECIIFGLERVKDNEVIYTWSNREDETYSPSTRLDFLRKVLLDNRYNSMCRKCVLKEIIPNEDLSNFYNVRMGEDLIQSIGIYNSVKNAIIIKDILYSYHLNPNSVTSKNISYGYNAMYSPFTSFEFMYDYATTTLELDVFDRQNLLSMAIVYISEEIEKISVSTDSIDVKISNLNRIKNERIVKEYICSEIKTRIPNKNWRIISYKLFINNHYLLSMLYTQIVHFIREKTVR